MSFSGRRVLIGSVVLLLLGAAWTMASGAAQVPDFKQPKTGQYEYQADLLSTDPRVHVDVPLDSPGIAVYLNGVGDLIGMKLPADIAGITPIVGVQVFDYRVALSQLIGGAKSTQSPLTELAMFPNNLIITLTYSASIKMPAAITLLVPGKGTVQYMILTASTKVPTSGPFQIASADFSPSTHTITIVVSAWPVGDTLVCSGP